MHRLKVAIVIASTIGVLSSFLAHAEFGGTEFSAEIVQRGPQGKESTGKMYVGKDRVRTDMTQNEQKIIHIVDNKQRIEWLLYPSERSYMVVPGAGEEREAPSKPQSKNPCEGIQGATCRNLGEEQLFGRQATKWEMSFDYKGQTMTSTQWIDKERGIPLRQVMSNGQTTELRLLSMDNIDGRTVEKWEMTSTRHDEEPKRAYQWYDPKLGLAIREEFPGGYLREFRSIREEKQPDALFSIPPGYSQMSAPTEDQQRRR